MSAGKAGAIFKGARRQKLLRDRLYQLQRGRESALGCHLHEW